MNCKYPAVMAVAVLLAVAFAAVIPAESDAADADYNIVGEVISIGALPEDFDNYVDAMGTYAIKFNYVKAITEVEDQVFNFSYDIIVGEAFGLIGLNAYAVGINAAGEKETFDGQTLIHLGEEFILGTDDAISGEIPMDKGLTDAALTGNNVGGSLYVLVTSDAALPAGLSISACLEYGNTPVSNTLSMSIPGTADITVNGQDLEGAEYKVPAGATESITYYSPVTTVTIAPGSNLDTIKAVVLQDYNILEDEQVAAIQALGTDRLMAFYIDFVELAGQEYVEGTVTMDILYPTNLADGEKLTIVCINEDGTLDYDAATMEGTVITFNHNSTYVVYVENEGMSDEAFIFYTVAILLTFVVVGAIVLAVSRKG